MGERDSDGVRRSSVRSRANGEVDMDTVREAPRLLGALFDDGGASFLAEAGLPPTWAEVLRPVPVDALRVPDGPDAGWRQLSALRDLWSAAGLVQAAIASTQALLRSRGAALGKDHPDAVLEQAALGTLLQRAGRQREGGELLDRAWSTLRSVAGGRDLRVAVVAQNVAASRLREGQLDEAEHALEIAYRIRTELAPGTVALVAAQLGEVRHAVGRSAEAVPLLQEAVARTAEREGPGSPRTLARSQMLGTVLNQLGRYREAAEVLRPLVAALRPDASAEVRAAAAFELGLALHRTGIKEEAARRVEDALRLTRQLGTDERPHASLANRVTLAAELHLDRGRLEAAEGLLQEAIELDRRRFGDASPEVASRFAGLGAFLLRHGRADEALGWLDAACSLLRSTVGDGDARTTAVVGTTVGQLLQQVQAGLERRDMALARVLSRRALEIGTPVLGRDHEALRQLRQLRDKYSLGP
jgi:tetratricopeptide (TPR) repeat protein